MTAVWDLPDFDDHEGVHAFTDPESGLRAVIALHSTKLGPAAGGTRFWHYADNGRAVTDALRLSRGMSFKNAMAGLELGGGKGVVLAAKPGDVITTGTPAGVGAGMKPPVFLKDGDIVTLGSEHLGEQRQMVSAQSR